MDRSLGACVTKIVGPCTLNPNQNHLPIICVQKYISTKLTGKNTVQVVLTFPIKRQLASQISSVYKSVNYTEIEALIMLLCYGAFYHTLRQNHSKSNCHKPVGACGALWESEGWSCFVQSVIQTLIKLDQFFL